MRLHQLDIEGGFSTDSSDKQNKMETSNREEESDDEEMDEESNMRKEITTGKKNNAMGNETSRRLAQEYREILRDIKTWELIVEQQQAQLINTTDSEGRKRMEQNIANSKQLLRDFKQQEKNHIMSGICNPNELWGDDDMSDDEDSGEILSVSTDRKTKTNQIIPANNIENDIDMVITVTGKRKKSEDSEEQRLQTEDFSDDDTIVTGERTEERKRHYIRIRAQYLHMQN
jgi:hypothetical protein